ncbi:MAG: polyhydroxyalkanoic acid synthase, partial [Xanthobacteraceae bacterium]
MSKPLVVSIPHHLGKDEAVRRLKSGLGSVRTSYGHLFNVQEETWSDNRLQFRVSALGQAASGTID